MYFCIIQDYINENALHLTLNPLCHWRREGTIRGGR